MTEVGYDVKLLDTSTWPDFAALAERHNGVWGGCWCMGYHDDMSRDDPAHNRSAKERRVRTGQTHAVLVYDGESCVGWCQYGPTAELGIIRYRRDYAKAARERPDWRITCFFVARRYRGRGVAATALDGALTAIARSGGGLVESYPEEFNGRAVEKSLPYMYNGLADMFERRGFERIGRLGKNHWLMTKVVAPEAPLV